MNAYRHTWTNLRLPVPFSMFQNAYARNGQAEQAEKVFAIMEDRVRAGDLRSSPNIITYSCLMNAWAKSGERDAATRAKFILEKMERNYAEGKSDIVPNERCYNIGMRISWKPLYLIIITYITFPFLCFSK
jgi:hypothetical protein